MDNSNRIPLLDLARLAAAMAVVLFHYGFQGGVEGKNIDIYFPALASFAKYGYLGVDVFFMISGLVIAWSAAGAGAFDFARRRFLRVYPTFIFCAAVTALVIAVAADPRYAVTWEQFLAHVTVDARRFDQPLLDDAYWTIVFEIFFYVMVTVGLFVPILRRNSEMVLWAWLAISVANEAFLQTKLLSYFAIADYSGLFILGITMFRIHRQGATPGRLLLTAAALAYALERANAAAAERFSAAQQPYSWEVVTLVVLGAAACLYLILGVRTGRRSGAFFKGCGALTYPLYLLHGTIGYILINRLAGLLGASYALATAIALVFLLSWIVASLVEPRLKRAFSHALRLGAGLGGGRTTRAAE